MGKRQNPDWSKGTTFTYICDGGEVQMIPRTFLLSSVDFNGVLNGRICQSITSKVEG